MNIILTLVAERDMSGGEKKRSHHAEVEVVPAKGDQIIINKDVYLVVSVRHDFSTLGFGVAPAILVTADLLGPVEESRERPR